MNRTSSKTKIKLKANEVEEYKKVFLMFDKSNCGSFGVRELREVMTSYGMATNHMELKDIISELDTSGDERVDFEEFLKASLKTIKESELEEELREAFKVFDREGNGLLSVDELRHVLTGLGAQEERLTEEELQELIREVDMDGSALINYEELIAVLSKINQKIL